MIFPVSIAVLAASIYVAWTLEAGVGRLSSAGVWLRKRTELFVGADLPTNNTANDTWNLLYHLGGNGPWVPKLSDDVEGGNGPPEGCRIDQVHMISRHAERYPTPRAAERMVNLLGRLRTVDETLQGDLMFFRNWTFFMDYPGWELQAGELTSTGPYAGTLGAFWTGMALRVRYEEVLQKAIMQKQTHFWAADSKRVVDTAKYFAAGFFGIDWSDIAHLHIIPETRDLGADTLTTGITCKNYVENLDDLGREYGLRRLDEYRSRYLPPIAEQLHRRNPGLELTDEDVYTMQELCGFDLLARGSSPWCDVFTHEEWLQFEHARDVLHYYRTGPGNKYSAARAWPFLNATMKKLSRGSKAGPLFLSFVHDGDILPLLTSLDLIPTEPLSTTNATQPHPWHTSQIVPMRGRLILERIACPVTYCHDNAPLYPNHVYCENPTEEVHVRAVVNDAVVPIPGCDTGPGKTCPLRDFEKRTMLRGWQVGTFEKVCGTEDAADRVTFLHQ